jgi:hypothetical protein
MAVPNALNLNVDEKLAAGKASSVSDSKRDSVIIRVDFNYLELCAGCNPVTCTVNGEPVSVRTWRDLLVNLVEMFMIKGNPNINDLFNKPLLFGSKRPSGLKQTEGRRKEI